MEGPAMAAAPVMQGLTHFGRQGRNTAQQQTQQKPQNMAHELMAASNQPSAGMLTGASAASLGSAPSQPHHNGASNAVFRFDESEQQGNQNQHSGMPSTHAAAPTKSAQVSGPMPASAPPFQTQAHQQQQQQQQGRRQRAPRPSASDISHLLSCMASASNAPQTQSTNALLSPSDAFVSPVDANIFDLQPPPKALLNEAPLQPNFPSFANELSQGAPTSPGVDAFAGATTSNAEHQQEQQQQIKPGPQVAGNNAHFEHFFADLPQDATDETVAALNPGTKEQAPLACDFDLGNIPSIDDAVFNINTLELPGLQDCPPAATTTAPATTTTTNNNTSAAAQGNPWTLALPAMLGDAAQAEATASTEQQQQQQQQSPGQGQGQHAGTTAAGGPQDGDAASPATSCGSLNFSVFTDSSLQTSPSDTTANKDGKGKQQRRRSRKSRRSTEAVKASRRVSEMSPERVNHVRKLARLAARRRRHQARVKDRMRERLCDELLERNKALAAEREQLLIKFHALVQVATEKFPHLLPGQQQQ